MKPYAYKQWEGYAWTSVRECLTACLCIMSRLVILSGEVKRKRAEAKASPKWATSRWE